MVDVEAYPDELILKAFWLQRHIQEYGIEGIHFMDEAQDEAENGDSVVAGNISARLRLNL